MALIATKLLLEKSIIKHHNEKNYSLIIINNI